jgi:hypothetical protein
VSLALPMAWSFDDTGQWNHYDGPIYGWEALISGWGAMLEGQFAWCANLLFWPALFLPGRHPARWLLWVSAIIGLLIAACLIDALLWTSLSSLNNEIVRPFGAGRLVWLAAIGGATVRLGWFLLLAGRSAGPLLRTTPESTSNHL